MLRLLRVSASVSTARGVGPLGSPPSCENDERGSDHVATSTTHAGGSDDSRGRRHGYCGVGSGVPPPAEEGPAGLRRSGLPAGAGRASAADGSSAAAGGAGRWHLAGGHRGVEAVGHAPRARRAHGRGVRRRRPSSSGKRGHIDVRSWTGGGWLLHRGSSVHGRSGTVMKPRCGRSRSNEMKRIRMTMAAAASEVITPRPNRAR